MDWKRLWTVAVPVNRAVWLGNHVAKIVIVIRASPVMHRSVLHCIALIDHKTRPKPIETAAVQIARAVETYECVAKTVIVKICSAVIRSETIGYV
jgi:DNA-binding protein